MKDLPKYCFKFLKYLLDKAIYLKKTKELFLYRLLISFFIFSFFFICFIVILFTFPEIKHWKLFDLKEIKVSSEIIKLQNKYENIKLIYNNDPQKLKVKIDSIWEKAVSIPVNDYKGRKAILDIYTLSNGYYWVKGKFAIRNNFEKQLYIDSNSSFIRYIKSEYFAKGYSKCNELICVGNSSFEENVNTSNEECRSYYRAVYLKQILTNYLSFAKISIFPIGKSDKTSFNSDIQRTVVIIGVIKIDSLIDIKNALYLHLLTDKNIPFRFWDYSLCKNYNNFYSSASIPCEGEKEILNNK